GGGGTPMVSIVDNSSCPEGGACVFSITSDTAGSTAISGTWTTSNGTAVGGSTCTAGIDFVSGSGTWNISASSSTANLGPTVTICTDAVPEAADTFTVTITVPSGNAALSPATATATIPANPTSPAQVTTPAVPTPAGA